MSKNPQRALKILDDLASYGHFLSIRVLALLTNDINYFKMSKDDYLLLYKDYEINKNFESLKKSADLGYIDAIMALGDYYSSSLNIALSYYNKAGEMGCSLGYVRCFEITKDILYLEKASQYDENVATICGKYYYDKKDLIKARYYFNLSNDEHYKFITSTPNLLDLIINEENMHLFNNDNKQLVEKLNFKRLIGINDCKIENKNDFNIDDKVYDIINNISFEEINKVPYKDTYEITKEFLYSQFELFEEYKNLRKFMIEYIRLGHINIINDIDGEMLLFPISQTTYINLKYDDDTQFIHSLFHELGHAYACYLTNYEIYEVGLLDELSSIYVDLLYSKLTNDYTFIKNTFGYYLKLNDKKYFKYKIGCLFAILLLDKYDYKDIIHDSIYLSFNDFAKKYNIDYKNKEIYINAYKLISNL